MAFEVTASAEGDGKVVGDAVLLHGFLLVRFDADIAQWTRGAEEHETVAGVFFEETKGCRLVHFARKQPPCTRDAPALKATVRQIESRIEGSLQDEFGRATWERVFHAARDDRDLEDLFLLLRARQIRTHLKCGPQLARIAEERVRHFRIALSG